MKVHMGVDIETEQMIYFQLSKLYNLERFYLA